MAVKTRRFRKFVGYATMLLVLICLLAGTVGAISNRRLPSRPTIMEHLSRADKTRLAEALRLKESFGDQLWPDFQETDIPVILFNDQYEFLIGVQQPPERWETVSDDTFQNEPYYRRKISEVSNFAIQIDDGMWAGSVGTKWQFDGEIISMIRDPLPPVIENAFPYRLLIFSEQMYVTVIHHEAFHAFQAQSDPMRFEMATEIYSIEDQYPFEDESFIAAWKEELKLLADALKSDSQEETITLTHQFLDQRDSRRSEAGFSDELAAFEYRLEWLEGLARYIELSIWKAAAADTTYQPLPDMLTFPDFDGYDTYSRRWRNELNQFSFMATNAGDTRFYYTGMAQAVLLDRLMPGWKDRLMNDPDLWLEDLLAEAVK